MSKKIMALFIVMFVIIAIQGFYIYQLSQQINSLSDTVSSLRFSSDINEIDRRIDDLDSRISSNEADVLSNSTSLQGLVSDVNKNSMDIQSINTDIQSINYEGFLCLSIFPYLLNCVNHRFGQVSHYFIFHHIYHYLSWFFDEFLSKIKITPRNEGLFVYMRGLCRLFSSSDCSDNIVIGHVVISSKFSPCAITFEVVKVLPRFFVVVERDFANPVFIFVYYHVFCHSYIPFRPSGH